MARAPAQLNPSQRVTSLSIGKILLLTLGVLLLAVGGTWYFLLHTHTGKAVREKIYTAENRAGGLGDGEKPEARLGPEAGRPVRAPGLDVCELPGRERPGLGD